MIHGMNEVLPSSYCHKGCKPITSTSEYHCIICHESFYKLRSFDEHRFDPETPENESMECWMPQDCGLELDKGMWAFPEDHEERRKIENKLQKAREAR
jgi:hypothetical protein